MENKEKLIVKKHVKCNKPKVTVIVPVFKVEKYLVQCLNSIVNQTLEEIEIIIVDEGLQDRCREIIDYFEANDPRIIAPHQANGGYGASCNLGFKMAKGEYVAIVESDDYIDKEMYEEMYEYAKSLDADVVKTPYKEFYQNGVKKNCNYRKHMREVTPSGKCFSMKQFGDMLSIHASLWAAIYKTEYIRKNNIEFVTAKGGAYVDVGFRIDTLINTDKIAWLDKPYYNYRVDSEGSTTNNFNLSKMIARWSEVHDNFKDNQEDYDKYYGKYLILDEYLNTLGWLHVLSVSKQDLEGIIKNFSYVKDETIKESPVLDKEQKKEILDFKKDPSLVSVQFKKKARLRNFVKLIVNIMLRIVKPAHFAIIFTVLIFSLLMEFYFKNGLSNIFHYGSMICIILLIFLILMLVLYELLYLTLLIRKRIKRNERENE